MKTDKYTLVRGARQLLTLHQNRGPRRGSELADVGAIADGSVLLRNGLIEAVGPTRRIENMAGSRDAEEIDAAGRVVMPAFIDCHACLVPTPAYRGSADENHRTAAEKAVHAVPAGRLEAQAGDLLKTMARHGTATIGALSGYGSDATGELKILRALRARDKQPLDIVSILHLMRDSPGLNSEAAEELLRCVSHRKLARIAQLRCGAEGFPPAAAESLLQLAKSLGFSVRVEMLAEHGPDVVNDAVNMQALSITTFGPIRTSEIESLSFSPTFAILLPALLSPTASWCHGRQLIDDGARIALASGISPENNATASMQTVVQLACERLSLSVAEAISATTINAAWALGVGEQTGSLEYRKFADLILLNASDYREIPMLAGTNLTYLLMKRGMVVFKEDFPEWPSGL